MDVVLEPVKKVEIITDAYYADEVIKIISSKGISGYTLIKDVRGSGGRGLRDGMGLIDEFRNSYVLVACSEEQLDAILPPIGAILKKAGGVCLVTDAGMFKH